MKMIPIFVVDRPFSLKILEGLTGYGNQFGILSHAFTSDNFKMKFKEFPLTTTKIGDSGIFQGKDVSYDHLFTEYIRMGVSHGIIKDYYRDPGKTLKSARSAIKVYHSDGYDKNFKLVGVAQGRSVDEYIENYTKQRQMGYEMVAIGGLLDKVENHVRLVKVRREELLTDTLRKIKKKHPNDKLFPLGVFNRSRIGMFKNLGVWGSDYKGWIFRYDLEESLVKHNRLEQTRNYIKTEIFPMLNKDRLLIISCTQKKKYVKSKAINLYDGASFRVLRKYLDEGNDGIEIRIISAKYGIIDKNKIIEPYDQKLTYEKAAEFKKKYVWEIKTLQKSFDDRLIVGGKNYRAVFEGNDFKYAEGRIGEQLSQLKKWLYSGK